ncbi:MAG: hypothetical protein ACTHU0_02755 [Kofleriaceae bacterium]
MKGLVLTALLGTAAVAHAETPAPKPADKAKVVASPAVPMVGDALPINGVPGWPAKLDWLYDSPSFIDATGKVVIHWFCAPKIATCIDDLARIVTLKENGRVYVVAYINGTKNDAKKLDPIRESEGVGRGTLAYGRNVTALMKRLGITGPASFVVDVDGKVAMVNAGGAPADLDARDAKVNALTAAIKEYTASSSGPKVVKPNDSFQLAISIKLSPWLKYSQKTAPEFKLTAPSDIKCDNTVLKGPQVKIAEQGLTAQVTCSGPKGIYELRGTLTFGYDSPTGGTGIGTESATWKFEIKPMGMQ